RLGSQLKIGLGFQQGCELARQVKRVGNQLAEGFCSVNAQGEPELDSHGSLCALEGAKRDVESGFLRAPGEKIARLLREGAVVVFAAPEEDGGDQAGRKKHFMHVPYERRGQLDSVREAAVLF